jgi:hypothetical protein
MDHFSRTIPIIGSHLLTRRAALFGLPAAAPLVRDLAGCGLGRWLLDGTPEQRAALAAELAAQHGPALDATIAAIHEQPSRPPDLVIGLGSPDTLRAAWAFARAAAIPALLVAPPTGSSPCAARAVLEDDDPSQTAAFIERQPADTQRVPDPAHWPAMTFHYLAAGLARAILLRGTDVARADLAGLWEAGRRELYFDHPDQPLRAETEPFAAQPAFQTPPARRGMLLVAGLGSLGSVAALALADSTLGMVIADPDQVDAANPVRQAYPVAAIGRPKAETLAGTLRAAGVPHVVALSQALDDEDAVSRLIAANGVTAGLVATGTAADFAIARALRAAGLPHVIGRCYPRARYWEAVIVNGIYGPSLSDLRGHLALGPAPAPTPEQVAAYSDAGALEAEPATLVESGWAAAWLARLSAQLLAPPGLRERWLLDLLAGEQTCLIGGVQVEQTQSGPAYAIAVPGQIRAWGRGSIRSDVG